MTTQALYRFFDESGELLYVGITTNPAARWKQHSQDKDWWHEVAQITVEPHAHKRAVLDAEMLAIKTERPKYNVVHAQPKSQQELLRWNCGCGWDIRDGEGALFVTYADLAKQRSDYEQWEFESDHDGLVSIGDIFRMPGPAPWRAFHYACEPQPEQSHYSIYVSRLRTHLDLLNWTLHLSDKRWLKDTNWTQIIRRQVGDFYGCCIRHRVPEGRMSATCPRCSAETTRTHCMFNGWGGWAVVPSARGK